MHKVNRFLKNNSFLVHFYAQSKECAVFLCNLHSFIFYKYYFKSFNPFIYSDSPDFKRRKMRFLLMNYMNIYAFLCIYSLLDTERKKW